MRKRTARMALIVVIVLCIAIFATACSNSIDRTAQRGFEGSFIIAGETYISIPIGYTEEGKTIAQADNYDIKENPEDPNHNFLAVRNFLDNWTIVKESYVIPTSGKLNVAYCDHERIVDGVKLRMVQSILDGDYQGSFIVKTDGERDIFNAIKSIKVGYEDCPVGTDWLGSIGNINGYLVFVEAEDLRESNLEYTCHVLHEEYQKLYENSVKKEFEALSSTDMTHQHTYLHEIVEPGCTEEGYTIFRCSDCGYHFISNQAEPYGHAYEIVDQKGEKTVYRCMRCGDMTEE